ncbi:cold shock domain-containing protein [Pseudomonas alloputida]|uniref:cold shock domain-containing protein n=1 Tax=Pseudomonas alloputida TaxID=1940621 RepID=UPI003B436C88
MSKETGFVTFADNLKGFGFIRRATGKDAFFLYSEVQGFEGLVELFPGDTVIFETIKEQKGPKAVNILKT